MIQEKVNDTKQDIKPMIQAPIINEKLEDLISDKFSHSGKFCIYRKSGIIKERIKSKSNYMW